MGVGVSLAVMIVEWHSDQREVLIGHVRGWCSIEVNSRIV